MTSDPDSSADTFAAERSYEVGDLSLPESPSTMGDSGGDTIGDSDTAGGPEPYQLEPLA